MTPSLRSTGPTPRRGTRSLPAWWRPQGCCSMLGLGRTRCKELRVHAPDLRDQLFLENHVSRQAIEAVNNESPSPSLAHESEGVGKPLPGLQAFHELLGDESDG